MEGFVGVFVVNVDLVLCFEECGGFDRLNVVVFVVDVVLGGFFGGGEWVIFVEDLFEGLGELVFKYCCLIFVLLFVSKKVVWVCEV